MENEVREALKEIEKALQFHAGGVELVACDEQTGEVQVHLTGTCQGCSMASVTLKEGIETALVRAVPGVRVVRAV